MVASAKKLFERALSLDDRERAELVGLLLGSIEDYAEDGVEEAWVDEISRRVSELDSGLVQMVTWGKVRSEVFTVSNN